MERIKYNSYNGHKNSEGFIFTACEVKGFAMRFASDGQEKFWEEDFWVAIRKNAYEAWKFGGTLKNPKYWALLPQNCILEKIM